MDTENKLKNNLAIPIAIVIAGALVASAIFWGSKGGSAGPAGAAAQAPSAAQPQAQAVDASKVKTAGVPYIGNQNAKVTFAFWSDYQCPFCKRFGDSIEQTVADYVKGGKVKILFKDFAFLGPDSQTAAIAGRAVWEVNPAKFYDWHKAMFEKQDTENGGWGSKDDIIALSKTILGASDGNKVAELMTSKQAQYQKAVDADKTEGASFGVNGTPGSVIGKTFINGAQPYSAVKAAIDAALSGK